MAGKNLNYKWISILVVAVLVVAVIFFAVRPTDLVVDDPAEEDPVAEDPIEEEPAVKDPVEITEYSFLMNWNGGGAAFPDGWEDSELANKLAEITGVRLKVETINFSEREKLAMIFAAGDLPDITNAPFWGTGPGGEGELIKNAAVEGLLLPLSGLIDDFPNIKRMFEVGVISEVYKNRDVNHPDFEGEMYVIPVQTGRTKNDVRNWAYNLYAREDILKALGVEPDEITTQQDIYDLLVKIRDGDFTDNQGRPVIPAGNWHNGWNYWDFLRGFGRGVSDWQQIDGRWVSGLFTQNEIDRVLFMRRLVEERLMDPESFTHTDTMAREKMITGRVAVHGTHFPHKYGFFKGTLYATNPEMRYVPLGPILDLRGEVPSQIERLGRTGSPVLFFSRDIENPEKVMNFIEFINSEEGLRLVSFGIEGVHHTLVNNIPAYTSEWANIRATDSVAFMRAGFGIGGQFIGADPRIGWGWDAEYENPDYVLAREINPLRFIEGRTVHDVYQEWPGRRTYEERMALVNWGDELKRAFLAETDEDAIAIIEAQRQRALDAGIEDLKDFVNDAIEADPEIIVH